MIVSIHRWTRVSSFHEFITPFPFQTTKQHFSRPSSSNIRKKKKKNILSSKFKLENLRKIVNRGTFRKKSIVFHEAERTIYNLRDGRLDQEMRRLLIPDSDFRARSLHQRRCKIRTSNFAAKCPIVSRFIKWNLKRPHYERQLNPQWHTGAEEKKPRSWKRKQFVKYCFRRWQTTRIRDPGFRRFKERGKYLNFAKYNFEI